MCPLSCPGDHLLIEYLSVWESEEWLQEFAKPLAQSGGASRVGASFSCVLIGYVTGAVLRAQTRDDAKGDEDDEVMEE